MALLALVACGDGGERAAAPRGAATPAQVAMPPGVEWAPAAPGTPRCTLEAAGERIKLHVELDAGHGRSEVRVVGPAPAFAELARAVVATPEGTFKHTFELTRAALGGASHVIVYARGPRGAAGMAQAILP